MIIRKQIKLKDSTRLDEPLNERLELLELSQDAQMKRLIDLIQSDPNEYIKSNGTMNITRVCNDLDITPKSLQKLIEGWRHYHNTGELHEEEN